jgi:hypothetical protein
MTTSSKLLCSALALSSVLVASAAHADTIPISVAARLGYGVPLGSFSKGANGQESKMSDSVGGVIPVQLDAMYALGFGLRLGVYGSYGILTGLKEVPNVDTSGSQTRLGLQAHFTLPVPVVKPWVGAGIGYEWFSTTSKTAGLEMKNTAKSLEVLNLQAGLQIALLPILSLGPYVQYQRATFSTVTVGGTDVDITSGSQAAHGWIQGGARAELSFLKARSLDRASRGRRSTDRRPCVFPGAGLFELSREAQERPFVAEFADELYANGQPWRGRPGEGDGHRGLARHVEQHRIGRFFERSRCEALEGFREHEARRTPTEHGEADAFGGT